MSDDDTVTDDEQPDTVTDDGDDDTAGNGTGESAQAELVAAQRAAAAANRELRKLRADRAEAEEKAKREAGEFKELYEDARTRLEELEGRIEREAKERLALAALAKAQARNPARAVKLLDLDEVDDEASAERVVKRLAKSDDYLFNPAATRQKRGGGEQRDDDDDEPRKPRGPVNRLRRGLEATAP